MVQQMSDFGLAVMEPESRTALLQLEMRLACMEQVSDLTE